MSIESLYGLLTDADTLLTRLSATRAGYLDNLASVTLSSRASSAEVAKAASYTSGRATNLDNLDVASSTLDEPPTGTTALSLAAAVGAWNENYITKVLGMTSSGPVTTSGYHSHVDITGSGYITFCFIVARNTHGSTTYNYGARITVDSDTFYTSTTIPLAAGAYGILAFTAFGAPVINSSYEAVGAQRSNTRYRTDFELESYGQNTSMERKLYYGYYPT